jgi:hypothetical protein
MRIKSLSAGMEKNNYMNAFSMELRQTIKNFFTIRIWGTSV